MANCVNGHPLRSGVFFCPLCGVDTRVTCENLHLSPGGSKFCLICGAPIDLDSAVNARTQRVQDTSSGVASVQSSHVANDGFVAGGPLYGGELAPGSGHRPVRATRIYLIGIAIVVIGAIAAFSLKSTNTPLGDTTTTIPSADGGYINSWVISLSTPNGNVMSDTIETGSPTPYEVGSSINGTTTAGAACSLVTGTDAVIPASIILGNVTSGTDDVPAIEIDGVGSSSFPDAYGTTLNYEQTFTSGSYCYGQNGDTNFDIYSSQPIADGVSSHSQGFFDITGFYSSGNVSDGTTLLSEAVLTVPESFTITDASNNVTTYTVTNVTGPGVVNTGDGWQFNLDGS